MIHCRKINLTLPNTFKSKRLLDSKIDSALKNTKKKMFYM